MSGIQLHVSTEEIKPFVYPKKSEYKDHSDDENDKMKKKKKKQTQKKPEKEKEFPQKTFQNYLDSSYKNEEKPSPKEKETFQEEEGTEEDNFSTQKSDSSTFSKDSIEDLNLCKQLKDQLNSLNSNFLNLTRHENSKFDKYSTKFI
jgi:hypothetical protein